MLSYPPAWAWWADRDSPPGTFGPPPRRRSLRKGSPHPRLSQIAPQKNFSVLALPIDLRYNAAHGRETFCPASDFCKFGRRRVLHRCDCLIGPDMISKDRWRELLSECPAVTMPADEAELERLRAFVPKPPSVALAVFGALREMNPVGLAIERAENAAIARMVAAQMRGRI